MGLGGLDWEDFVYYSYSSAILPFYDISIHNSNENDQVFVHYNLCHFTI